MFEAMTGNNDANKSAAAARLRPQPARRPSPADHRDRLVAIVRAKDPTRPVTVGAAFPELSRRTGLLDRLDLVGYNYKETSTRRTTRRFPDQPMVGSENGHSYPTGGTSPTSVHRRPVPLDRHRLSGRDPWLADPRSGAGLLTIAGFDKHTFHLRRSWWSEEPVAYIVTRPHVDAADKNFWSHPVSRHWDGDRGSGRGALLHQWRRLG